MYIYRFVCIYICLGKKISSALQSNLFELNMNKRVEVSTGKVKKHTAPTAVTKTARATNQATQNKDNRSSWAVLTSLLT